MKGLAEMTKKSKLVKQSHPAVAPELHKSLEDPSSIYGGGITLGRPGDGALAIRLGEKRRPLAVMFYDAELKKLEFDRAEGVTLEEFVSIMRKFFPNYGLAV